MTKPIAKPSKAVKKPEPKKPEPKKAMSVKAKANPFNEIKDIEEPKKMVEHDEENEVENGEGEKKEKGPRFLAIYKTEDSLLAYVTAVSSNALKKELENIPIESIVLVWKGKPKEVKTKSVLSF